MFEKLKSLFKKPTQNQYDSSFGSYNTITGEFSEGYMEDGKMKFKDSIPINNWCSPTYAGVITLQWKESRSRLFGPTTVYPGLTKVSLYKEVNRVSGQIRYFFNINSKYTKHFIDPNAFEQNNTVVFLDDWTYDLK